MGNTKGISEMPSSSHFALEADLDRDCTFPLPTRLLDLLVVPVSDTATLAKARLKNRRRIVIGAAEESPGKKQQCPMDAGRSSSARTARVPTNSIAVRRRMRSNSPTMPTNEWLSASLKNQSHQQTRQSSGSKNSTTSITSRLAARSSLSTRYHQHQAHRWAGGPPSPTKTAMSREKQGSNAAVAAKKNPTAAGPMAQAAGSKLRARAASRNRGDTRDPPPQGHTGIHKTAGAAPMTGTNGNQTALSHPNSIQLTRRRLSQPNLDAPPKTKDLAVRETSKATLNASDELVCDYDSSATLLYEYLESSKWEEARSRCRSHPLEVRTWIVRRDKSNKIRWKLLPLHAAIIFQSSNAIVSALLEKYPHAASCPDDQGMLPLHLAFRHKQEDENLLELLLVQYPKAVLLKDKRQRVPLEHGRESKFSAKLVWLYADATVIANRGNGSATQDGSLLQPLSPTTVDQHTARTSINTSLRADVETEIRTQHEVEVRFIRESYEEKIQSLQEQSGHEAKHIKLVLDDERQTILERHTEEVTELKDMLNEQMERESNLVNDLQVQIGDLQGALEDSQEQNDGLTLKFGAMEVFNRDLRNQLQSIIRDQLFIRDLATRQTSELDAARKMRAQIIQTLQQQEDTDGENDRMRSHKLIEMAENVRDRIHDILRNDPAENTPEEDEVLLPMQAPVSPLGPSRIEVERGGHESQMEDPHLQHHPGGFFEERDEVFLAKIPELELREDEAMDMKSLGDEISGITEHSAY